MTHRNTEETTPVKGFRCSIETNLELKSIEYANYCLSWPQRVSYLLLSDSFPAAMSMWVVQRVGNLSCKYCRFLAERGNVDLKPFYTNNGTKQRAQAATRYMVSNAQ